MRPRLGLEKDGLHAPCVPHGLFNVAPARLVAEAAAQVVQQGRNLRVGHARAKTRHDRAALAFDRLDAGDDFNATLCRQSYGISLDEQRPKLFPSRKLYVFNPDAWTEKSLREIPESTR